MQSAAKIDMLQKQQMAEQEQSQRKIGELETKLNLQKEEYEVAIQSLLTKSQRVSQEEEKQKSSELKQVRTSLDLNPMNLANDKENDENGNENDITANMNEEDLTERKNDTMSVVGIRESKSKYFERSQTMITVKQTRVKEIGIVENDEIGSPELAAQRELAESLGKSPSLKGKEL